ncbi:RusA family crossover junction endodeoxyribonuclease [Cereibacter sediminicola]|uniref:RusA family crossover junction endodeoxyribonuclease n=1 Tax=Cereibacter sediminicola TaxID=2584941 RepID=UPI001642D598|nr:RusA family crossover junction endodeoxyribonuclease [Cereibacter sediminicola]
MPDEVVVVAHGTPRPQPRPRICGRRVVSTANPLAKEWREVLALAVTRAMPSGGVSWPSGVDLAATFVFSTRDRKRHGRHHLMRPDADNLAKLAMDVLQDGGLLPDGDSDVASMSVRKVWGRPGEEGVVLRLRPSPETAECPAELCLPC